VTRFKWGARHRGLGLIQYIGEYLKNLRPMWRTAAEGSFGSPVRFNIACIFEGGPP